MRTPASVAAAMILGTILGRRDVVVLVRRWRQQGPVKRVGVWTPIAVIDDLELAGAMADLIREGEPGHDVSVVSADELLHTFPSQDRERILDRLNSRTVADIERDLTLRREAEARIARRGRRSGLDRRSGRDRRIETDPTRAGPERRSGYDRRTGRDRRRQPAA